MPMGNHCEVRQKAVLKKLCADEYKRLSTGVEQRKASWAI